MLFSYLSSFYARDGKMSRAVFISRGVREISNLTFFFSSRAKIFSIKYGIDVPRYQHHSASTRWPSFDMIRNTCTYTYTHRDTCRWVPMPPARPHVVAFADIHVCVLQRNSANHSRAYSDACHNERRATFCFGPVGRKYRPFWIFNFQRSSKPLRGPLLPRRSLSPFLFLLVPIPVASLPPPPSCHAEERTRALYDGVIVFTKFHKTFLIFR